MVAEEKLKEAAMPGSMQQDLDRRVNQKEKPLGTEYTFKPQITKAKTKEDFEQAHRMLESKIASRKSQASQITVTQEFGLSKGRPKPPPPDVEPVDKFKLALMKAVTLPTVTEEPAFKVGTTNAQSLIQKKKLAEVEAKLAQEARQQQEAVEREARLAKVISNPYLTFIVG